MPVQSIALAAYFDEVAVVHKAIEERRNRRHVADVTVAYGSRAMSAVLCLVILSVSVGWVLGGPAREDRRVLAIGTAWRNVGLGALVATTSFRQASGVASSYPFGSRASSNSMTALWTLCRRTPRC